MVSRHRSLVRSGNVRRKGLHTCLLQRDFWAWSSDTRFWRPLRSFLLARALSTWHRALVVGEYAITIFGAMRFVDSIPGLDSSSTMKRAKFVAFAITLSFLASMTSNVIACNEGFTSASVHFSGTVISGETFQKSILQDYYLAKGLFGQSVKVAENSRTSIYFWLVPKNHGWLIQVGPQKDMTPDYIAISSWPNEPNPSLYIGYLRPQRQLTFCFTAEPRDYADALAEIRKTGKSDTVEIFARRCKARGDDDGMGLGTLKIKRISEESLKFVTHLKVPVYTTDCPPP